jgi:hypothetical protein
MKIDLDVLTRRRGKKETLEKLKIILNKLIQGFRGFISSSLG